MSPVGATQAPHGFSRTDILACPLTFFDAGKFGQAGVPVLLGRVRLWSGMSYARLRRGSLLARPADETQIAILAIFATIRTQKQRQHQPIDQAVATRTSHHFAPARGATARSQPQTKTVVHGSPQKQRHHPSICRALQRESSVRALPVRTNRPGGDFASRAAIARLAGSENVCNLLCEF